MKRIFKWTFITALFLPVLIIAVLLIAPFFMDIQKYKPQIENRVSEITGRPFTLGGDMRLSLFPLAGLSLSDIRLDNPPGFETRDFLSVKSLEVRLKLLPLLSKDIRITRFSLKNPMITLIKNRKGAGNWEGIGRTGKEGQTQGQNKQAPSAGSPPEGLSLGSLALKTFILSEGALLWIDRTKGEQKEIRDLAVEVDNLSLFTPVLLKCSATVDQHPLSVHGTVGPIGESPGKGTVPVDLSIGFLKDTELKIKGNIIDPAELKEVDLRVQIPPFSPRKLFQNLSRPFPLKTAGANALNSVALACSVRGDSGGIALSDGLLSLDNTHVNFSGGLKNFSIPEITFDLILDRLDVDDYLPLKEEKGKNQEKGANQKKQIRITASSEKNPDDNVLFIPVAERRYSCKGVENKGGRS